MQTSTLLVGGVKSGYNVLVVDGLNAVDVLVAANTCNASAANSRSTYFAHTELVQVGSTGQRSFASDHRSTIYQLATGAAIANTMAGTQVLQ